MSGTAQVKNEVQKQISKSIQTLKRLEIQSFPKIDETIQLIADSYRDGTPAGLSLPPPSKQKRSIQFTTELKYYVRL